MSKIEFFKPEDFLIDYSYIHITEAAKQANHILNQKIGPEIVFEMLDGIPFYMSKKNSTHKAYLFNIEEIKPKECEHEAHVNIYLGASSRIIESACKHCGVKLKAEWKEVKP